MSRHFDLMQEMERERSFQSDAVVDSTFPVSENNRRLDAHRQALNETTLGLVQRIFLQSTVDFPRTVVFAAIDHGNGCSQIAASVAETLAGSASGTVCLVEANFRSPSL